MSQDELSGPDLAGVIADANAAGLKHVVIGGFSVIFHGFVRATRGSDLLVPDGEDADEAILRFLELTEARRLPDGGKLGPDEIGKGRRFGLLLCRASLASSALPDGPRIASTWKSWRRFTAIFRSSRSRVSIDSAGFPLNLQRRL